MSAPDSITVTVADHNGVAVLSIGGEIDLITAAALEEAIGEVVADNPTALVIDLSAVEFLGSVGLKILAATSEKIGQSVKFGVVARGSVTRRPIHLMGLDKTFRLFSTLHDALTGVRAAGSTGNAVQTDEHACCDRHQIVEACGARHVASVPPCVSRATF